MNMRQAEHTDLTRHAHALAVSGYTTLRKQIDPAELEQLRKETERALAASRVARKAGRKLAYTGSSAFYEATRCLYCWGDASRRLLEHESIHALAGLMMGKYLLWDLSALSALPTPADAKAATTGWHRDFGGPHCGSETPSYLWFFVCLDDVTPDNGATWLVPGSHRLISRFEPDAGAAWSGDSFDKYPSQVQVCANAGDLVVLNPALLHSSGRNASSQPRRLLNLGVCHADLDPLLDHWAIAGPAIQQQAGKRLKSFLGADRKPQDATWTILPDGWRTGRA